MKTDEMGYFTEENSADVVISRNARAKDARLAEVMARMPSMPATLSSMIWVILLSMISAEAPR